MNYVRLPLSFALYLVYRISRAWHAKELLMRHGVEARALYLASTPMTFKAFRGYHG